MEPQDISDAKETKREIISIARKLAQDLKKVSIQERLSRQQIKANIKSFFEQHKPEQKWNTEDQWPVFLLEYGQRCRRVGSQEALMKSIEWVHKLADKLQKFYAICGIDFPHDENAPKSTEEDDDVKGFTSSSSSSSCGDVQDDIEEYDLADRLDGLYKNLS
jgi:hypothetical protein